MMKLVAGMVIGATLGALLRRLVGLAIAAAVFGLASGKVDRLGPVSVEGANAVERITSVRWNDKPLDPAAVGVHVIRATSRALDEVQGRTDVRLVRVVDGDTVDVREDGKTYRVRVLGINTPEVYGGAQCYGAQASASAKRWAKRHRTVTLRKDRAAPDVDKYGRRLRYVEPTDGGRDLSTVQVAGGYARVAAYGQRLSRLADLESAERRARRGGRGLWGAC